MRLFRRRLPTRQKVIDHALEHKRHSYDNDSDYFNPHWFDFEHLKGDKDLLKQLIAQARAAATHISDYDLPSVDAAVKTMMEFSLRQRIRKRRLPVLEHILSVLPEKNENWRSYAYVHRLVKRDLSRPPTIIHREDDCLDDSTDERLTLAQLIALWPSYDGIIAQMRKRKLPDTRLLQAIPQQLDEMVLQSHPDRRVASLQANLIYNPKSAVFQALALFPEIHSALRKGSSYRGIPAGPAYAALEDPTVRERLGDFPLERAKAIITAVTSDDYSAKREAIGQFPITAEMEGFYAKLIDDPAYQWAGIQGYLTAIAVKTKKEMGTVMMRELPQILKRIGMEEVLRVPIKDIIARYTASRDQPSLTREDPFGLSDLPEQWDLYRKAAAKIKKHFPKATLDTFSSIVGESYYWNKMRGLDWMLENYTLEMTGFQDPLLIKLVTYAGRGVFTEDSIKGHPVQTLASALPLLKRKETELPPDDFERLLKYTAEHAKDNPEWMQQYLELITRKNVWKKFGADTEQNDKKRKELRSFLWREALMKRGVHTLTAEKEQSLEAIDAMADDHSWKHVKNNLPFGQVFLDGFYVTPHSTYKVYRRFAVEKGLAEFVLSLVSKRKDNHYGYREDDDREADILPQLIPAYKFYDTLRRRITGERKRSPELQTLKELHDEILDLRKPVANAAEAEMRSALARSRLTKAHQIVSKRMNSTLELLWGESYHYGLGRITGKDIADERITADLKQAVAVYFVSDRKPELQAKLLTLINDKLENRTYTHLQAEENRSFLESLTAEGIDADSWMRGMEREYAVTKKENRRQWNIDWHVKQILHVARKYGIEGDDVNDVYDRALASVKDRNVIRDLQTQMDAIKRTASDVPEISTVRIRIATDPLEVLKMGDAVDGSCLSVGGGSTYSVISNAIDLDKKVLYAEADGRIVGRKLIAVSSDRHLVQFRTYTKGDLDLDEPFESFIGEFAAAARIPLAHNGEVTALYADAWYDDGIKPFTHVRAVRIPGKPINHLW